MTDVTVVGSGPNGLVAAVVAARAGLSVRVLEAAPTIGGGLRTAELTLPGFRHDVCSTVHPAGLASPVFRKLGLLDRVDWVVPEVSYAHPLGGGRAGIAWRDLDRTADGLEADGAAWRSLLAPLLARSRGVVDFTGSQLLRVPHDPVAALKFGLRALEQGTAAWNTRFVGDVAPALFSGVVAHAAGGMPSLASAGAGLLIAMHGHGVGWGLPIGGSQTIADALADELRSRGGEIVTDAPVASLAEVTGSRAVLLDTSPELLFTAELPGRYARALRRYRYGSGVAKVDFALSGPVPWRNAEVRLAPTVHLGGSRAEIAAAENAVARGYQPGIAGGGGAEHPYVLVAQPTVADPSRAPAGQHVLWAYTHVPAGSTLDPTELVTAEVERFAPGFRDVVLASAASSAAELGRYNANYVGGDIYSGALTMAQLLKRPVVSPKPWRTPVEGVYLCSSATPPGPAVHGMNGWFAAKLALRERFGLH
ncbi:phytoene desaturase family protein [Agromyces cerinus]|uniref:Pyridine nucleotide-disulfide oxidoreductase domain-containing protein 2 n=1 Tax=Agromyces cerinus subsp. cerinus TaxID=232089 RepID=A0A1N6I2H9_9MICO|nr:NAD(P)/FAD-dependent oxidoreductase [Agromyces cerinus]SIO26213.1 Phytoene dehydrogenase-related protein [Agromyces cerinus subsp. cerinus]